MSGDGATTTIHFADGYSELLSETIAHVNVPILNIIDEKIRAETITGLGTLNYSVISQISAVEHSYNEIDDDLLTMVMVDGSIIQIRSPQITAKMPYYLAIREEVIEQFGGPMQGIYYLDVGNYFKPF